MAPLKLYLFQCGETDRYAISNDMTGCNLPKDGQAWLLRAETTMEDLSDDDLAGALDMIAKDGYCLVGVKRLGDDAA